MSVRQRIKIGLIGDYNEAVTAHRAIPFALQRAAKGTAVDVAFEWIATSQIDGAARVSGYDGLWCVPGSPYRHMEGALLAITHARTSGLPFFGSCGGFQHAVIEYARNVLGWRDAEHAETAPDAPRTVIALLQCPLVEKSASVHLQPGTKIAAAYRATQALEGYHCSYGLNLSFADALTAGPLRATAHDDAGEVRAVELHGHPFFVATLFQSERAALREVTPPLILSFVHACAHR
jgi:CTP synthase (UTP-ammonia lyase)